MKKRQFIILGLGRFGNSVIDVLIEHGYDILAVDKRKEAVQSMATKVTHVIQGDVREDGTLDRLGFNNFDVAVVSIGRDMEASIMSIMKAKEEGVGFVIAKAETVVQKKILERIGADRVVLPDKEMGTRVATNLITTTVLDFITLSDEFSIAEIEPLNKWCGKTLINANIRGDNGLNVVAIKRGKKTIVSPDPNIEIGKEDILVVIGENKNLQLVKENDEYM